jgi:outer membrane protein OmpA-like peptidoglycan-associated protein
MNNLKIILSLSLIFVLFACRDSGVLFSPKYKTTIFRGQQGETEVTNFNRKQAEREKSLAETLEKADEAMRRLEDQKKMFYSIDSTERIKEIDVQLDNLMARTQQIINSLNEIDPYSPSGHEKSLLLAIELNDLLFHYIYPVGELILANKEIKNISADISFETGSAELTKDGKVAISTLIQTISKDIADWKSYLDQHNENVFNQDEYKTILVINGYSDLQGVGNEKARTERNQDLSEKRAAAVASEFEKQLTVLKTKLNLTYSVTFFGMGENLPPQQIDNGKLNNPNRRITTVSMVVGPKILLYVD